MLRLVFDTNVIVSAMISRRGASFQALSLIGTGRFTPVVSVPLVLEYEDAAKRLSGDKIALAHQQIDDILDYLCAVSHHQNVFYLWRPQLSDPRDDMVLEVAVNADCHVIVTHNQRDFQKAHLFAIRIITPQTFLQELGNRA